MLCLCCRDIVSDFKNLLCVCVYTCNYAFVQAELSLGLQALPVGRRSRLNDGVTSSAQNHSPGSETETRQRLRFQSWKDCLAIRKTFRQRHQKRMNSCLTTGAADQQTVTDWQTEPKMAMRSLRHTKPTGSLKQDLFFRPHGETVKSSLPSLYL